MSEPGSSYTTAEVDELTERASLLMDQLREVFREIRQAVGEIVAEETVKPTRGDGGDADVERA